ncbi:MAG: nitrate/nitrite transporter NrtS [Pseudomonadales bacterium]|jgi:hypothetical protein
MEVDDVFWEIAWRRDVRVRAFKTAVFVGVILIAINHADALLAGAIDATRLVKMLATMLVPYSVSTYASVRAIQSSQVDATDTSG